MCRIDSLCALVCAFCVSRNGETGEGGRGHPQGIMHMMAVVAGCRNALVGTGWSNSHLGWTNGLLKMLLSHCRGFISGSEGNLSPERVFAG